MSTIRALIEHTEDCDKFSEAGTACTCGAQEAWDELKALTLRAEQAEVMCARAYIGDTSVRKDIYDALGTEFIGKVAALKGGK